MVLIMIWKPRGLISHRDPTVFLQQQDHRGGARQGRPRMSARLPIRCSASSI